MTVKTCTKVNIGLHVLRRRADGYHDLDTLFVPYYGFGDLLTVEPAAATTIEIIREELLDITKGESNAASIIQGND